LDKLQEIEVKISSLKKEEWQLMIDLIPRIVESRSFGELIIGELNSERVQHFPYMVPEDVVVDFERIAYDLNIVISFDWSNWTKGSQLINDPDTNYGELDLVTLVKLITAIIRADRFNEGLMVSYFESGLILKILEAIKLQVDK